MMPVVFSVKYERDKAGVLLMVIIDEMKDHNVCFIYTIYILHVRMYVCMYVCICDVENICCAVAQQ